MIPLAITIATTATYYYMIYDYELVLRITPEDTTSYYYDHYTATAGPLSSAGFDGVLWEPDDQEKPTVGLSVWPRTPWWAKALTTTTID
jgi:hypothetical protein